MAEKFVTEIVESYEDHSQNLEVNVDVNEEYQEYEDTGKPLSEALIFASTNPIYDDKMFIELQVQYMKIPSSILGRTCCVQKLFWMSETISVHNMFSPGLNLEFLSIELVIQWTICRHIVG